MIEQNPTNFRKADSALLLVYDQLARQGREAFFASLYLMEIDWENTPLTVLGKLIKYEAVHKMDSLEDLRARLKEDRKIYAFFHSDAPHEPLIFVQVAFTKGIAHAIDVLLDAKAPILPMKKANTLIFYSISNAQEELKGINFGRFLIQRVVDEVSQKFSQITTFATLSPIPGFSEWLRSGGAKVLISQEKIDSLLAVLASSNWYKNPAVSESMKPLLMRLCAHYLLYEKCEGRPIDPVANFHLFNGAEIEEINWLADLSSKGLERSCGLMVNYVYHPTGMERNHQGFVETGKVVASTTIEGYL